MRLNQRSAQMFVYLAAADMLAFLAGRATMATPRVIFRCDLVAGLGICSPNTDLLSRAAVVNGDRFIVKDCRYFTAERISCDLNKEHSTETPPK
jgi:hypothetical protein